MWPVILALHIAFLPCGVGCGQKRQEQGHCKELHQGKGHRLHCYILIMLPESVLGSHKWQRRCMRRTCSAHDENNLQSLSFDLPWCFFQNIKEGPIHDICILLSIPSLFQLLIKSLTYHSCAHIFLLSLCTFNSQPEPPPFTSTLILSLCFYFYYYSLLS